MRTTEDWLKIFSTLPSPNAVEVDMAARIIDDLVGYRSNARSYRDDVETLANGMVAYAKMLQEHGVKV